MKRILLTIALILTTFVFARAQEATNDPVVREKQLQLEVLKLEHEIQLLQKENEHLKEEIKENKQDSKNDVSELKENLLDKMDSYVSSFTWIASTIALFVTFLGYRMIKKQIKKVSGNYAIQKVDEAIREKLTEEFITSVIGERGEPKINKQIEELRKNADDTIAEIKNKGNELLSQLIQLSTSKEEDVLASTSSIQTNDDLLQLEELFKCANDEKDLDKRIELYKQVLEMAPNAIGVLNNLAAIYNDTDRFDEAIKYLDRAISLDNTFGLAYVNRAISYYRIHDLDKAIKDASKAIQLSPQVETPYLIKVNVLCSKEEYEEAQQVIFKLMEINPNSADAYFKMAFIKAKNERFQESLNDYLKAEELGYDELGALYKEIAINYYALEEYEKSVKYIDKAIAIDPDLPDIVIIAAEIYSSASEEEKFYENLKRAIDNDYLSRDLLEFSCFYKYRDTDKFKELMKSYEDKADAAKVLKTKQNNT